MNDNDGSSTDVEKTCFGTWSEVRLEVPYVQDRGSRRSTVTRPPKGVRTWDPNRPRLPFWCDLGEGPDRVEEEEATHPRPSLFVEGSEFDTASPSSDPSLWDVPFQDDLFGCRNTDGEHLRRCLSNLMSSQRVGTGTTVRPSY